MATRISPTLTDHEARALFTKAHAAGMKAGEDANPTPMVIRGYEHEPVMDGVCGFAWVKVMPGNGSFARWLKKNTHAHPGYSGGTDLWVREFNQSLTRKEAYARAFAGVLKEAGVEAYGQSRID